MTKLFDDTNDLSPEAKAQIAELFGLAVDREVLNTLEDLNYGELIEHLQEQNHDIIQWIEQEVSGAVNSLAEELDELKRLMNATLTGDHEQRQKAVERLGQLARANAASMDRQDKYAAGVDDDFDDVNRDSLRPSSKPMTEEQVDPRIRRYWRALSRFGGRN